MKLDDFLKVKKVRLLTDGYTNLNKGSEYNLVRLEVVISNNAGIEGRYPLDSFEPVIDSAENPLQNIELTPEFEAVEPKFKVGDKVYCPISGGSIFTLHEQDSDCYPLFLGTGIYEDDTFDYTGVWRRGQKVPSLYHATEENYKKLSDFYPHIEFEQPPKVLTGSDLCRAMLEKGWKYVPCYVHDGSDDEAINRKHYVSVKNETPRSGYNFSGTGANDWKYAVPIDPRTGEPLIQAVLDE